VPWLYVDFIFFEKYENLKVWWHFKVPQANSLWVDFGKFQQFWAVLGRFCCIHSG
jgi:hypothetical protein